MEYFGTSTSLSADDLGPGDVVVGTAPDSLLGLVTEDLPDNIFDMDDEEDEDFAAAAASDEARDFEVVNDLNLAASSPSEDSSLDTESDLQSPLGSPESDTSSGGSSGVSGSDDDTSVQIFEEVPFFSDQLDIKEEVIDTTEQHQHPLTTPFRIVSKHDDDSQEIILPPSYESVVYDSESEAVDQKVRHSSADSQTSTSSSGSSGGLSDDLNPPPALPASLTLDDYPMATEGGSGGGKGQKESSVKRPRMSYAQLIAEALMNASDRRLTLNDIYVHINARHPYYSLKGGKGWQNAVRHNLTLNKSFVKVPRPANEGRGSYWELETGAEKAIFKRLLRQHYMYKVALDAKTSSVSSSSVHCQSVRKAAAAATTVATASHTSSSHQIARAARATSTSLKAVTNRTVTAAANSIAAASAAQQSVKPSGNKPQIKIIKSIPLVSPKVTAAVSSSSSSKPTIIYVTLPKHLFKS